MKKGNTSCFFFHTISAFCLSIPPLTFCTSEPKLFQDVPGQRTQPPVRHLTLTHYSPSFLCLCQPSTSSSHRLSWTVAYFVVPKKLHPSSSPSLSLSLMPDRGSRGLQDGLFCSVPKEKQNTTKPGIFGPSNEKQQFFFFFFGGGLGCK